MGAVGAFLALAVAGLQSVDPATVRAVYRASQIVTWAVIVPLSGAALLTGLVQAIGTPWGVFRHYWVLIKLLITVLATVVLMIHTQPIDALAAATAAANVTADAYRSVRVQIVVDAAAALIALSVATVLSIYKPKGLTPYGWRKQRLSE
jgi:hypothetical protein